MKRIMYVLQNEDGSFYWKSDSVSSMHGLNKDFKNAYLFKTKQGAERIKKYHIILNVLLKKLNLN